MSLPQRIAAFRTIQAIPYRVPVTLEEAYVNNCSCSGKSEKFSGILAGLGLQTRQRLCVFKWDERIIPRPIMAEYHDEKGVEIHQFTEVLVPEHGNWVVADPTWDAPLAVRGFPVPEWDGLTSTPLAVKSLKILELSESDALLEHYRMHKSGTEMYLQNNYLFFNGFNAWLTSIREGK
ncbi:MAG: hypothetical protein WAX89_07080 [Alphaproteobacteria bacterium]